MYAADRACVNTMAHANDLCDELGSGLDRCRRLPRLVGSEPEARNRACCRRHTVGGRLSYLRLAQPTTDLLNDRGMMGDGVIDLPLIRSWMEGAGYRGA